MNTDYKLTSYDELTMLAKSNGIESWNALTSFVKDLPYGRNKNRTDLGLVITEKKGSCSSKHALLKKIADLNGVPNISLILGIYKMKPSNTPKIANVLIDNTIECIPEAHCYLKVDQIRVDFTTNDSEFKKIEEDIIQEKEIEPEQVSEFKVEYHKNYLKKWITESKIGLNFEEVWQIREKCIEKLSE